MDVLEKLYNFYERFEGEKGYIGLTEKKNPIPYFKVVKSEYPVMIISYAIHAREYVTTYLSLLQINDFNKRGKFGTVYFIPAVNIDGIKICLYRKPLYKANANGVDLNVNFDARWGTGVFNVRKPADENYIGRRPFSESESKALSDFTLFVRPDITLSYHSKGEEIYWKFFQEGDRFERDYKIAKIISNSTGYKLKDNYGSVGGYKDWCIEKLKIPSFTLEVGSDSLMHPILEESIGEIFIKNRNVINDITEFYND